MPIYQVNIPEPKYQVADYVECIDRTEENHEKLVLGRVYHVVGSTYMHGDYVYSITDDSGNLYHSIDRFKKVGAGETLIQCPIPLPISTDEVEPADMVNHPSHYADRKFETMEYVKDNMSPEGFQGYLEGNVIKYISRYKKKNGVEDLKKCRFYLSRLISEMGGDEPIDAPVSRPITDKQRHYIAGLTESLGYNRANLPKHISPLANYKELSEAEAVTVIDRLVAIKSYLEGVE